ncbi:PilZ domain-containing protein [Geobacter sp. AOG1]|uniref:PilZ domain-containing protein n=1 Tax=Geobacter sp. AOG1 TaxID=1566346 RepID=UPI001CC6CFA1|nr:PilZ domain-containing protein [Geobacter sp. AOG1]
MKNILLVSPSESFRERNAHLLIRSDFQITAVASGTEALHHHQNNPVDIVISELQLDDMGGDELCTLLRQSPGRGDFSFIMVCRDIPADIERVEKSTANYCITKPVRPVQLLKAVGDFASAKMLREKRVPLRVRVKTIRDGVGFYGVSHDVSVTGILLETEEKIELREQITCYFSLPDFGSIETRGEVMRYERTMDGGYKYGVQFTGLTRGDHHKIDQYVASTAHDESRA